MKLCDACSRICLLNDFLQGCTTLKTYICFHLQVTTSDAIASYTHSFNYPPIVKVVGLIWYTTSTLWGCSIQQSYRLYKADSIQATYKWYQWSCLIFKTEVAFSTFHSQAWTTIQQKFLFNLQTTVLDNRYDSYIHGFIHSGIVEDMGLICNANCFSILELLNE